MARKHRPWKPTQTLWLPGDKPTVLEYEFRRALRRDEQLTPQERNVYNLVWACRGARRSYPWWRCTNRDPCVFCQEALEV